MIEKMFRFDGSEMFFQGHFPQAPVLPGVVQLGLARKSAEELSGGPLVLRAVKKMKFVRVIRPGEEIVLRVDRRGGREYTYEFICGEETCSSGVLVC